MVSLPEPTTYSDWIFVNAILLLALIDPLTTIFVEYWAPGSAGGRRVTLIEPPPLGLQLGQSTNTFGTTVRVRTSVAALFGVHALPEIVVQPLAIV